MSLRFSTIIIIVALFGAACTYRQACIEGPFCPDRQARVLAALNRLDDLSRRVPCEPPIGDEEKAGVAAAIDMVEGEHEIAALATALRAFSLYEDQMVSCRPYSPGRTYNLAFWKCLEKLAAGRSDEGLSLIRKIESRSEFDHHEKMELEHIINGTPVH